MLCWWSLENIPFPKYYSCIWLIKRNKAKATCLMIVINEKRESVLQWIDLCLLLRQLESSFKNKHCRRRKKNCEKHAEGVFSLRYANIGRNMESDWRLKTYTGPKNWAILCRRHFQMHILDRKIASQIKSHCYLFPGDNMSALVQLMAWHRTGTMP